MKRLLIIIMIFVTGISFAQQQSVTTQGREFFTVFMQNGSDAAGTSDLELSILVSAKRACSVTVRNPNSTWTTTFNVSANNIYKCIIPNNQHDQCYLTTASTTGQNKGLLITSTDTISVYTSNFSPASFDGSIIIPVDALNDEYIIQTFPPAAAGYESTIAETEFSITATEDNTIIDVTPSVTCRTGASTTTNSPFTVTLNRGQSTLIRSTTKGAAGDLSGTIVKARDCKKIAVLNGDNSTQVPSGNYCDHIYEQAFPISSWGKKFIVTNSQSRSKDVIRVTASANNTTVRKNGTTVATLGRGQTYQFELTSAQKSCYIETSNPSAVYLYLVSVTVGGSNNGDPSMLWIAPVEQKIDEIVFNTFMPSLSTDNQPSSHSVNIVTETNNTSNVRLDGAAVTGWTTVNGNAAYSFVSKTITHTATSPHKITGGFIAHVYGIGNAVSYAYNVGSMATNLWERMYINGIGTTDAQVNGTFCQGNEIEFTSEVDYSYNNITWNFDDGTTEIGNSATHIFDEPGTYTVSMQVNANASGCTSFNNAVNYELTINPTYETERTTNANYGETITIEGASFVARNDTTINRIYTDRNGCDSTVIHHVIISTITNNITADICQGEIYNLNGFNESATGNYTHTYTLPNGIDSVVNLMLTVHEVPNATIIGNNAICNGSVALMASGGTDYIWSNGITTSANTVTEPGDYSVTVSNEFCSATARRTIRPEVQITLIYDPILCNNSTTDVIVAASNGIPPYTGEQTITVGVGSQSFRVTDAEGCTARQTITLEQPTELSAEKEESEAFCNDEYGTVTITPAGGTAPYSIVWDDNSTSFTNERIVPGIFHTFTIYDRNGCSLTDSTKIGQEPPITITLVTENALCYNTSTGEIRVTNVNNGHPPYSYIWSDGQTTEIATDLAAGSYSVTVTDDHGCNASARMRIQQPSELTMESSVTNASCVGMCDGRIVVAANGGTPGYSYRWNTGYNETEITELCYGNYALTVTDANGCKLVEQFTIIQPESMSATATATDVSCFGYSDGKISVTISGGSAPFEYALNEFMYESSNSGIINSLAAGSHMVYIRDSKGCLARAEGIVGSPDRIRVDYEIVGTSCKDAKDGEIHLAAAGGTEPYYVTTDAASNVALADNPNITNLSSGTYHMIITDENGCSYSLKNVNIPENLDACIHIPNVFTPNDDGINDTWELSHIDMYPDAKIFVFNRWGQKLYSGNGTSEYWDGYFKGHKVPAGTYSYIVNLGEGLETYSGSLSVLY